MVPINYIGVYSGWVTFRAIRGPFGEVLLCALARPIAYFVRVTVVTGENAI